MFEGLSATEKPASTGAWQSSFCLLIALLSCPISSLQVWPSLGLRSQSRSDCCRRTQPELNQHEHKSRLWEKHRDVDRPSCIFRRLALLMQQVHIRGMYRHHQRNYHLLCRRTLWYTCLGIFEPVNVQGDLESYLPLTAKRKLHFSIDSMY